MSKLIEENTRTVTEIAHQIKSDPATVNRWITRGIVLKNGQRLKLEACRVGGRWLTSTEALFRFIEAQNSGPPAETEPQPARTGKPRRSRMSAADQAGAELERLGA
jgi:hypothetical protein